MAEITELKVDYDSVTAALETLQAEIGDFEEDNENAFDTDRGNMEAMNSDFVAKILRILECVPDWTVKSVLDPLKTLCSDTEQAMEEIQTADEAHSTERVEGNDGRIE